MSIIWYCVFTPWSMAGPRLAERKRMPSDGRSSDSNTLSSESHTFVEYSSVRLLADTVAASGIFKDISGSQNTPSYLP
jgi:hypothetical protein